MTTPDPPTRRWLATGALRRAVFFVGATLLLAVLTARPDLAVLAAPVGVATALALWRRPAAGPEVRLDVATPVIGESGDVRGQIEIRNPSDVRYDLVVARTAPDRWLQIELLAHPCVDALDPWQKTVLEFDGTATRWGRRHLGPVYVHAVAADGLLISQMTQADGRDVRVYPMSEAFAANAIIARAAGMVGFHRSRRPGDGGELASVRPFGPGDRLRRIDWRVSLRTRELHVSSTLSDRDAEIVVILDVTHEAGRSGGVDGFSSALDTTVRAAAGIANYYLHHGDRVSMLEHGHGNRRLRAATGHRHYLAVLEWLLDVRPVLAGRDLYASVVSGPQIAPNALIICLTPILDADAVRMLARFARSGRSIVTVDTMPAGLLDVERQSRRRPSLTRTHAAAASAFGPAAARLWRYDRANTIAQLREHGVPVVPWAGPGSLDQVLQQVARVSQLPRMVR